MRKHTRAHRLLTASTVLFAGGVMFLPTPTVAQPERPDSRNSVSVISGAAFQIRNPQTGKCMTVAGGRSTENNVRLVQFNCDTDPSRRWKLTNGNDNSYQLVNAQTRKCATVAGGRSTENNIELVQFDCDSDASRRWSLVNWDGGAYELVNDQTGKCATVAGGRSTDNNVGLVQFDCDRDRSRTWTLNLAG
ncbi:RICIN domain-containing protein [Streptomyces turgidiscabies]|uniref:Ricin-type beta-trefoil lectin domain protein n=1 Tax=Streptomyces turgidiscabies (strain Car8) TaxID=698760 RepID=L7EYL0_STRT8|nr:MULTISPECIES: RICIN domain-containing protein [Streptomyces]ELP64518.1 ricin-type beta-trefoil lectin domain protein [Streptomyces turgidiscabies Car8]MDX3495030.1 RICIN domain-containing protein [Streptomyces turgidiscabies]GAQ70901.1 hypothetical protein T45_02643 [Streptomyces turgidiscabies]